MASFLLHFICATKDLDQKFCRPLQKKISALPMMLVRFSHSFPGTAGHVFGVTQRSFFLSPRPLVLFSKCDLHRSLTAARFLSNHYWEEFRVFQRLELIAHSNLQDKHIAKRSRCWRSFSTLKTRGSMTLKEEHSDPHYTLPCPQAGVIWSGSRATAFQVNAC